LKLNGNIDWKWAYIFIPLWFIFGLIFVWTAILFTKYQYKVLDLNSVDYQTMVNWRWYADYNVQLGIVIYDCLLCFSIFVCLQLDHTINWDWFYIFIPLWVISLTWFYWWNESRKYLRNQTTLKKNVATTTKTVTTMLPLQQHMNSYHQQQYNEIHYFSDNNDIDDDNNGSDSPLYIESGTFSLNFNLKTYQFVISIGIIVFNIFLPLQLDKKTTDEDRWSWWIIFLPLWVSLLVWFWSLCSYTFIKSSKSIHVAAVYTSQNVPLWIELIIFYITWFIITIFTIVLSIELDHHHNNSKSKDKIDPLTIFSPVIILLCINWWLCFAYIFYYKRELSYYNNGSGGSNQSAATIGILNKDLMNIKINFNSS
jgi:hypothetical protein